MFCANCGSQIDDNAKFCTNCGAKTDTPIQAEELPRKMMYKAASDTAAPAEERNNTYAFSDITSISSGWQWFCGVFKKSIVFQGRACRNELCCFLLVFTCVFIPFSFICSWISGAIQGYIGASILVLPVLLLFVFLLPLWGLTVRRYHDIGKKAWWFFIPIYGLVLLFSTSDAEANCFGEVPQTNIKSNTLFFGLIFGSLNILMLNILLNNFTNIIGWTFDYSNYIFGSIFYIYSIFFIAFFLYNGVKIKENTLLLFLYVLGIIFLYIDFFYVPFVIMIIQFFICCGVLDKSSASHVREPLYIISHNYKQEGPYSITQLEQIIASKRISTAYYISPEDSPSWVPITDIPALKQAFEAQIPKTSNKFTAVYLCFLLLLNGISGLCATVYLLYKLYIYIVSNNNLYVVLDGETFDFSPVSDFINSVFSHFDFIRNNIDKIKAIAASSDWAVNDWNILVFICGFLLITSATSVVSILKWKHEAYKRFRVLQFSMLVVLILFSGIINKFTVASVVLWGISAIIFEGVLRLRGKNGKNTLEQLKK